MLIHDRTDVICHNKRLMGIFKNIHHEDEFLKAMSMGDYALEILVPELGMKLIMEDMEYKDVSTARQLMIGTVNLGNTLNGDTIDTEKLKQGYLDGKHEWLTELLDRRDRENTDELRSSDEENHKEEHDDDEWPEDFET